MYITKLRGHLFSVFMYTVYYMCWIISSAYNVCCDEWKTPHRYTCIVWCILKVDSIMVYTPNVTVCITFIYSNPLNFYWIVVYWHKLLDLNDWHTCIHLCWLINCWKANRIQNWFTMYWKTNNLNHHFDEHGRNHDRIFTSTIYYSLHFLRKMM